MSRTAPRLRRIDLVVVALVASAVTIGAILRLDLLFSGQLGYDEGVYWQSLRAIDDGHELFSATYSSQPPTFLDGTWLVWNLLGESFTAARAAMLASALVGAAAIAVLARRLGGNLAALVALAVWALDPIATRGSVMLEADLPSTAFGFAAVACAVECRYRSGRAGTLLAVVSGVLLAVAVLTKLFAVAFAPAIALAVLVPRLDRGRQATPLRRRLVLLGTGMASGLVATVLLLLRHLDAVAAMWDQVVANHLTARALPIGGFNERVLDYVQVEALPAVLSLLAVLLVFRQGGAGIGIVLAALFVVPVGLLIYQEPLWDHHLVLLTPGFAVGVGVLVGWLLGAARAAVVVAGVVALALGLAAAVGVAVKFHRTNPTEPATTKQLQRVIEPGTLVVTDDQFALAAADFDVPPALVDTSTVRILSGHLEAPRIRRIIERREVGAVVFSTGRLEMLPGFKDWVRHEFPERHKLEGMTVFTR